MGCHLLVCRFLLGFFFSSPPLHASPFQPIQPGLEMMGEGGIIRLWDPPTVPSCTSVKSFVRDSGWAKPSGHPVERVIIQKRAWLGSVSIPPGFHRSWAWARSAPRSCGTPSPWIWSMQWKVSIAADQTITSCFEGPCVWVRAEDEWYKMIECWWSRRRVVPSWVVTTEYNRS